MKKILLLGGSRYLLPVIRKARELGVYTITCDNIPENIAHKYSDDYLNISIIEKEKVLKAAKRLRVNGIMSFACDPGVVTAAYVAEKMCLPFQGSYEAVSILQDKVRFREFLFQNDFNTPIAKGFSNYDDALKNLKNFSLPVMIKPADSAGSKGVHKIERIEDFEHEFHDAMEHSIEKKVIVEEFLEFEGFHSSTDFFTIDGQLVFFCYSDQLFDDKAKNPYTPSLIVWPTTMKREHQDTLTHEISRLMNLLDMKTGIYNIEACVANGKPYIMEVSPRGGGCRIAEIQELCMGPRLIENEIRSAVGMPLIEIANNAINGVWAEMIVHSNAEASYVFKEFEINVDTKQKYIVDFDQGVSKGDRVACFTGANASLGDMFLHFDSREEMIEVTNKCDEWMKILKEESVNDTNV